MSGAFQIGPLPAGVEAPKTEEQRGLYRQALDLEGVFTQSLVDAMLRSAGGKKSGGGAGEIHRQMSNQTLNDALIDGGGLGLAGALYAQLATRGQAT